MKRRILCILALLGLSAGASASCYQEYQGSLETVNASLEESNLDESRREGYMVAGGLALTTTSGATGGSMAVSSTIGAKLVAAVYAGSLWMDIRVDDDVEGLLKNKESLEGAISILKEARVGNGPFLQRAMPIVWEDVSTTVSLKEVSGKILELDRDNAFCQYGQVSTPYGILSKTIEELKR